MKKTIFAVMLAIMLAAAPALAGSYSDTNPSAQGVSGDSSYSNSFGDHAKAGGWSSGSSSNYGTANFSGFGKTTAIGAATAQGTTGAVTGSKDFGNTSVAGGAAGTIVNGTAAGLSGYAGYGQGWATNNSVAYVDGYVGQNNQAREYDPNPYSGPNKTIANNQSYAQFSAGAADYNQAHSHSGWCPTVNGAASGVSLTGMAGTAGGSIATSTPGHSFAATGNVAAVKVIGADCGAYTNVGGSGYVQTATGNPSGTYAGGNGSFSYNGQNSGAGISVMNSTATGNGSSFSARSTGFSASSSR